MRKRYHNSEYLIGTPTDVSQCAFLQLSQAEEHKLQAIIDVLAEHGWSYAEEIKDSGYPYTVSLMIRRQAGQERKLFLDVRSSLLLYDLGTLLAHIDQAEHPPVEGGLDGLEWLLSKRQREGELVAAYKAKQRR